MSGAANTDIEVEMARCECCGLKEDCTPAYILKVRDRFYGHWICGLCAEAVKEEISKGNNNISMEDALKKHMSVCMKFKRSSPTGNVADAMVRLIRRNSFGSGIAPPTPKFSSRLEKTVTSRPRRDLPAKTGYISTGAR